MWGLLMSQENRHRKVSIWFTCPWLSCVPVGLMLLVLGCASGTTTKGSSMKAAKNVRSSAAELSSRNQSLLALYSAEIEGAADKVISESTTPDARRQALLWKAEAIPVMQTSLLTTDPVEAVLDTWAFIFQMSAYMERPLVKQAFGDSYSVVTQTMKNMDAEMARLVQTAAPSANTAVLRQKVAAWADAHPIQNSLAGRQSADPDVIRKVGGAELGTMASVKALEESVGDLVARLDSYNAYLPKQARWQAEIMLSDLARDPGISATMSSAKSLSGSLEKTSASMERMPELVDQTRTAVLADLKGQRLDTQGFLRQERLDTLDTLNQERIATLAALRGERLAGTADLRGERQVVLDALRNGEVAAMNEFKATSEKAMKDLDTRGRGLIDHFFVRALELVLLTLILCSVVAWFLLRRFASRRPERGERPYDRAA
jgi:hypothetical protein